MHSNFKSHFVQNIWRKLILEVHYLDSKIGKTLELTDKKKRSICMAPVRSNSEIQKTCWLKQDFLAQYLSEGEQYVEEQPSLTTIEEIEVSKEEGAFETEKQLSKNWTSLKEFYICIHVRVRSCMRVFLRTTPFVYALSVSILKFSRESFPVPVGCRVRPYKHVHSSVGILSGRIPVKYFSVPGHPSSLTFPIYNKV